MSILKKYEKEIDRIIELALKEDIGAGDITTELLVPAKHNIKAQFIAKDDGIICGLPVAHKVLKKLDPQVKLVIKKKDGSRVKAGEIIAVASGHARAILSAERLALNILQRLSGIATYTGKFVEAAKPYGVTILDTRKTTPMLRVLEKYAVKTGGATNHRMGLYDAVLIKDNHLQLIDIERAYVDIKRVVPPEMKTEIEVDTLEMLERVIKLAPDIIMLDNMSLEMIDRAMAIVKKTGCRSKIEVSGGVGLHNVREIARRRVDFISVGSITHSPPSLDISLKML